MKLNEDNDGVVAGTWSGTGFSNIVVVVMKSLSGSDSVSGRGGNRKVAITRPGVDDSDVSVVCVVNIVGERNEGGRLHDFRHKWITICR